MRRLLFASAAASCLTLGTAAMAQTTGGDVGAPTGTLSGHSPGAGLSEPASSRASNIDAADTRSPIAPRLPGAQNPGDSVGPVQLLQSAQAALNLRQTGAAQEALERAETRMLDRSTPQGMTGMPDGNPAVRTISQALQALGHNDIAGAQNLIAEALTQTSAG